MLNKQFKLLHVSMDFIHNDVMHNKMAALFGVIMYRHLWRNCSDRSYFTREARYRLVANRYGYKITKTIAHKRYLKNFSECNTNCLLYCLVTVPVA